MLIGTPRGPFVGIIAGHVDDGKIRIDPLARLPPFVLPASLTTSPRQVPLFGQGPFATLRSNEKTRPKWQSDERRQDLK
jgi:hypothetical protein